MWRVLDAMPTSHGLDSQKGVATINPHNNFDIGINSSILQLKKLSLCLLGAPVSCRLSIISCPTAPETPSVPQGAVARTKLNFP